jgi:tetratricopeptide (TPR) repeat protein
VADSGPGAPFAALPDRFGKYYVLGRVARGGMAEIYKVKTVGIAGFEKIQALKRILPAYARDPRFIRSFVDEAKIAVSLNHRNIVQVFEFGKVDEELFLAMELIDGVNLRDAQSAALTKRRPMSVALACHVLGEVAAGLEYAHRKLDRYGRPLGIVHCDISPPNVQLSYEGYVKILDFGVARATFATAERGRLRGKPRYMSPEQTRGELPTTATDVFALGVTAWEVLTGLPLFDGPDVESILRAIRETPAPDLGKHNPEAPEHLAQAIAGALEKDPTRRPSAADLAAAFTRTQREKDPGIGSRALAKWIAELVPSPVADVSKVIRVMDDEEDTDVSDQAITPEPEPRTLGEKRRVVAAACLLGDGGAEAKREARRILADIAYKHGAIVHAGEPRAENITELIALFGMEIAGEDDVAAAMRFSLDALEALRDAKIDVKIGVRQGIVTRRHDAGPIGYLLLGDALEEARAMALLAQPGRALLGGDPGRLTRSRYAFREHAPLRRRARRVRVLELLGLRPSEDRELGGSAVARGPFFGRTHELRILGDTWDAAKRGDHRVTCAVVGEPGIGKSRLVAELSTRVADERPIVIRVAAIPGGRDLPYSLVGDLFYVALGLPPARGQGARARCIDRLRGVLGERGVPEREADEVLATVEHALELRDGAAPVEDPAATATLRDRVIAAVATIRGLRRSPRPQLTIIEDLQWADGASKDALRGIVTGVPPIGAELIVITTRPAAAGEPAELPPGVAPIVKLDELGAEDRALMAAALVDPASDAASEIERRAGGNPLFIEELAHAVRAFGARGLPETARGVIAARVDRLPRAAKAALQHAAVVGARFRARLLEDLLGKGVYRALRLLEEDGLVVRTLTTADGRAALENDEGELSFRHGLIQEVVYDALSGAARKGAHRRIGALLAERHDAGRAESPSAIARHLELGGEDTRAMQFYLRAGRLALAAFDARGAVEAFGKALALGAEAHPDKEREAVSGRAEALFHLGDHAAQAKDLERLERLCADDPRRLADVLNRAAVRHLRLGEFAAAVAATEAAERAAESGGDERTRGESLRIRAEAFERQADFERALEAVTRALEIFRRIGAATEETRAMIGTGRIHLMGSRFEAALTHYAPALERVRNSGDQWLERIVCNNVSVIHLNRGDFAQAMTHAMRSLEICRRFGDRPREGDNASIVGTILLELGRYEEARGWASRGLAIHEETGSRWSKADALVYAAHIETLSGDAGLGMKMLEESIALGKEIGARYVIANAKNQLAFALIRRRGPGDLVRADREAIEAAEIGRSQALVACEIQGRSRSGLARLEAGDALGALAPSLQAVALLDRVRCMEWSEEEILYTHHRILAKLGDATSQGFLARAYAGLMSKLTRIDDPEWRTSFADAVELHRRIRADHATASRRTGQP